MTRYLALPRRRWLRLNLMGLAGLCLIAGFALSAVMAGIIAPYDPIKPNYAHRLEPPNIQHLLGTDELGRDLLSRLLYGARTSLVIGFVAEGLALIIGIILGTVAGWYGGWVDDMVMRTADIFLAVPGLMFLIVWVTIFEPTPLSLFVGLGLTAWPGNARLMRSQVLAIKDRDYILAAHAIGASTVQIWQHHLIPNAIVPIIVIAPMGIAGVILSESVLSFLGVGVQIPYPSWGTMIETARNYISTAWWYALFPGLGIALTVLALNFIGDGLLDILNPRQAQ